MYMLDTNACLDFTLGRSDLLRRRMKQSLASGLTISSITLAELRVGPRHPHADPEDARRLDRFIALLDVAPFDAVAADRYGEMAREVGMKRSSFDRLIAAHALSLDLILITNNEAHFRGIPGLRIENWTQ